MIHAPFYYYFFCNNSYLFQTYVQDLALKEASEIYRLIVLEKGHFYVCGDCTMAEHVYQTLKNIIQKQGNMNDSQTEAYMLTLRVSIFYKNHIQISVLF